MFSPFLLVMRGRFGEGRLAHRQELRRERAELSPEYTSAEGWFCAEDFMGVCGELLPKIQQRLLANKFYLTFVTFI